MICITFLLSKENLITYSLRKRNLEVNANSPYHNDSKKIEQLCIGYNFCVKDYVMKVS